MFFKNPCLFISDIIIYRNVYGEFECLEHGGGSQKHVSVNNSKIKFLSISPVGLDFCDLSSYQTPS